MFKLPPDNYFLNPKYGCFSNDFKISHMLYIPKILLDLREKLGRVALFVFGLLFLYGKIDKNNVCFLFFTYKIHNKVLTKIYFCNKILKTEGQYF